VIGAKILADSLLGFIARATFHDMKESDASLKNWHLLHFGQAFGRQLAEVSRQDYGCCCEHTYRQQQP